jgi:DnaJ-domain-containing protein 1
MRRLCHDTTTQTWRRRQLAVTELLRHAKIVTDPITLEYLNAQVALRRARAGDHSQRARRQPVS